MGWRTYELCLHRTKPRFSWRKMCSPDKKDSVTVLHSISENPKLDVAKYIGNRGSEKIVNPQGVSIEKFKDNEAGYTYAYIVSSKGYYIISNRPDWDECSANLEDAFDQILSTFKFLLVSDQEQTMDISNWKTYTNNQHGFSFKYPKELIEQNGAVYTELPPSGVRPDTNMVMNTLVLKKADYPRHWLNVNDPIGTRKEVAHKTYDTVTEKVVLDNSTAIKYREEVLPGSQTERVPGSGVLVDVGQYVLSIWLPDSGNNVLIKLNTTFDQILSTFRFE